MSDMGRNTDQSELLSVVVPAHNEAAGITHAIDVIVTTLASCGMRLEIIVVDDGSRDATFERVKDRSIADGRVKGLRFTRNFGKEAALLAGLRVASGEAVVTIDSDLQHPPALIPKMLEEWRKGAMVVDAVKRRPGCIAIRRGVAGINDPKPPSQGDNYNPGPPVGWSRPACVIPFQERPWFVLRAKTTPLLPKSQTA